MPRFTRRTWLLALGLLALPVALYWNTIFARFGLRDDYATINEMQFEPAKGFQFFVSQGRPLYGWMIAETFGSVRDVDQLATLRLLGAMLFGVTAAGTFLLLRRLKWDEFLAVLVSASLVLLPGVQVVVSWAVCWPHAASLVFALGAFALAEWSHQTKLSARVVLWVLAMAVAAAGTLTYQAGTQFYVALCLAAVVARRQDSWRELTLWLARHGAVLAIALLAAFAVTNLTFAAGLGQAATRMALESRWADKAMWFVGTPLERALDTFWVADPRHPLAAWVIAVGISALIATGIVVWSVRHGWKLGARWFVAAVIAFPAAYGVCMLAAERWPSYRTMIALQAAVLILTATALLDLVGKRAARVSFLALACIAAWMARTQAWDFFAAPQQRELARLEREAGRVNLKGNPRVFVVLSRPTDITTPFVYGDEFGSITFDAEWTVKETLRLIINHAHPELRDAAKSYRLATGPFRPRIPRWDVLIDLRPRTPLIER